MTEASTNRPARSSIIVPDARTKRRNAAEKRFRFYGLFAIFLGLAMLVYLLFIVLSSGLGAFQQTRIIVPVNLDQSQIEDAEAKMMKTTEYEKIIIANLRAELEARNIPGIPDDKALAGMLSNRAGNQIREYVLGHPDQIGQVVDFNILASSYIDGYMKGRVSEESVKNNKSVSPEMLNFAQIMADDGIMNLSFNMEFVTGTDASESSPEAAGFGAAIMGSLAMMIVVALLAIPIGVGASIYLEEFAPKNRWTDIIEVNISNLAAVPSIVFGILGLAVFINYMHLPKSAPVVGGLVLTLMTLPTIIISTRAALSAVPPSIRDAALGVGASKMQTIFHHVLPLAMPGILTGAIIGLAQALGESAPLLIIGMVGFIGTDIPDGFWGMFADPNTAMPAQIYQWSTRANPAFYERAWGGIIILLVFLVIMNTLAIVLRRKFERRW